MRKKSRLTNLLNRIIIITIFFTFHSCVNNIQEDEEKSTTPLNFIGSIQSLSDSRIVNNGFEKGDEVGLFAMINPDELKEERYIDNMKFIASETSSSMVFTAVESTFYPENNAEMDLIGYYPYQAKGSESGTSLITVSVKTSQKEDSDYSLSDFLVAKASKITSLQKTELSFGHKYTKVKIILKLASGLDESLLKAKDPLISAIGFYTSANYDLLADDFSSYAKQKTIFPHGSWVWNDTLKSLVGKDFILIPQAIDSSKQSFTIELDGRVYFCKVPADMNLTSGSEKKITITFKPSTDELISQVSGSIQLWSIDVTDANTSNQLTNNTVDISMLSFSSSNIYNVIYQGKTIAEICKEYLLADNITSRALVVYPVTNSKADLTKGIVLQLLDRKGNVHGGSVSWNEANNSLTYTLGTDEVHDSFYIKSDKTISLTKGENDLSISLIAKRLRDLRTGKAQQYPLVKIGTQYWMADNLNTAFYKDGTQMTKLTSITEGAIGYKMSESGNYYYTKGAIQANNIVPNGWKIPSTSDWNLLKTYLKDNGSLLKSGDWNAADTENVILPATNLTGFGAYPIAISVKTFLEEYRGDLASYWTLNEDNTDLAENNFLLHKNNQNMITCSVGTTKAFPLRCLKK
ncbi:MAG: fimbrillin family protein [Bacteroidaceae bacterium]